MLQLKVTPGFTDHNYVRINFIKTYPFSLRRKRSILLQVNYRVRKNPITPMADVIVVRNKVQTELFTWNERPLLGNA